MSTDFANILRCSIGTTEFQLTEWDVKEVPILSGGLRIGTNRSVAGKGYIEGDSAADFLTKFQAALDSMRISGQDFFIYEFNSATAIYSIIAAQCQLGGPHVSVQTLPQEGVLRRGFSFAVESTTGDTGGGSATPEAMTSTATGPNALNVVSVKGEVHRSLATAYFTGTILAEFVADHPPSGWVVSRSYEVDDRDQSLSYSISAEQLQSPLPAAAAGVVDGEAVEERDGDEAMRLTRRFSFDLLLSDGNYQPVVDQVRAAAAAVGAIMRESVSVTRVKQTRLQCHFEILTGRNGNRLMNWQQKYTVIDASKIWREVRFLGADPILMLAPATHLRAVQAGMAVCVGAFLVPPPPLYPNNLAEPPQVEYSVESDFEGRVTWTYTFFVDDTMKMDAAAAKKLARPKDPQFLPFDQ